MSDLTDAWARLTDAGAAARGRRIVALFDAEPLRLNRLTVEADLPDGELSEVHLQALPPRRTPTSFVIRFEYAGDGIPRTNGSITLTSQGSGSSRVELVLRWEGGIDRLIREDTERKAASFLTTLATTAEQRSSAA